MTYYKLPLVSEPQPEGGYTVTSPVLPELLTEGDTLDEARANVVDALAAVLEFYEDDGRSLPAGLQQVNGDEPIKEELVVPVP